MRHLPNNRCIQIFHNQNYHNPLVMGGIGNKNNHLHFWGLFQFYGSFLEHLINIFGVFSEPLVYRSRYRFTDLLNDFKGNSFVFYLRWLDGFYSGSHCVTSLFNLLQIQEKKKRKTAASCSIHRTFFYSSFLIVHSPLSSPT